MDTVTRIASAEDLWAELGQPRPARVEVLQAEGRRFVCRLLGAGPGGWAVIAKRCRADAARHERTVYERVLPRLSLPSLSLLGARAEPDGRHEWIFLDDAGGTPLDPSRCEHRALAGEWLGRLHVEAAEPARALGLPDPGPAAFRGLLRASRSTIREVRANPRLGPEDVGVLEGLDERIGELATHWPALEELCARAPRTLVHGDFKEENVRVRPTGAGGLALLAFDWHDGGFGAPALDLAKMLGYSIAPDLDAYASVARARWPELDDKAIRRLGYVGEACRCLASVRWEVERLRYDWVERPLACLRIYAGWMDEVLAAEPWSEHARNGPEAGNPRVKQWF